MTDVNDTVRRAGGRGLQGSKDSAAERQGPVDGELFEFAELLFFAYRDFTSDPDAILAEFGFGRAHHRVLHFVNRHPGLRVADILDILNITKQSLGRVLKQLMDEGYVEQRAGADDRRERLLFPTEAGCALAARLAAPQHARLARALEAADGGEGGGEVVRRFLESLVTESERPRVADLLRAGRTTGPIVRSEP